jgi:serine/threonine-protein kinase RIO1
MVTERNVLHGDLSPHNLIIHDKKGYFIDFDHAKFLQGDTAIDARGTVS